MLLATQQPPRFQQAPVTIRRGTLSVRIIEQHDQPQLSDPLFLIPTDDGMQPIGSCLLAIVEDFLATLSEMGADIPEGPETEELLAEYDRCVKRGRDLFDESPSHGQSTAALTALQIFRNFQHLLQLCLTGAVQPGVENVVISVDSQTLHQQDCRPYIPAARPLTYPERTARQPQPYSVKIHYNAGRRWLPDDMRALANCLGIDKSLLEVNLDELRTRRFPEFVRDMDFSPDEMRRIFATI
jgi:hypothetical protein